MNDDLHSIPGDAGESLPSASRRRRLLSRLRLRLPRRFRSARSESETTSSLSLPGDERPVEELDARLQALRQRSSAPSEPVAEAESLFDVDELLVRPEIIQRPGAPISPLALTKAQQDQVELLREMAGGGLSDAEKGGLRSRLPSPDLAFSTRGLSSLLIALFVFIGVALPFVSSDFNLGELPLPAFGADRASARVVYDSLDGLLPGEMALVALEYGPAAAGELDALTDLVLRHIFARGAVPVIVSGNPIAIARARNIIKSISRSVAAHGSQLIENRDYFVLRYLSGGVLGLRDLSRNFSSVVSVSARGEATGLRLRSLDSLSLIALVAERAEDVRHWAEQVAPETNTRFVVVTGYAAQPLAQPYVDQIDGIDGLIYGFRDVFTYGEMLEAAYAPYDSAPRPTLPTLTQSPVASPSAMPSALPSETPTPSPIPTSTPLPGKAPTATLTALPSASPKPIQSESPTARPKEATRIAPTDSSGDELDSPARPTADGDDDNAASAAQAAIAATIAPSATPELVPVAIVKGPQQARIRQSDTTASEIIGLVEAGEVLPVLELNADGSWLRVQMSNGWRGWIADFLVDQELRQVDAADESAGIDGERSLLRLGYSLQLGKDRPRIYQAPAPMADIHPEFALRRNRLQEAERLHAMTLGLIAAVAIILLGNAYHLMRALLRGGRGSKDE